VDFLKLSSYQKFQPNHTMGGSLSRQSLIPPLLPMHDI
jgi:hypothetical protein